MPVFPPIELLKFEGMSPGMQVILEINLLGKKQKWISEIKEFQQTEQEIFFVDEGLQLPFPFKDWHHKHRLIRKGNETIVRDEMSWNLSTNLVLPFLPAIKQGFRQRNRKTKEFLMSGNGDQKNGEKK